MSLPDFVDGSIYNFGAMLRPSKKIMTRKLLLTSTPKKKTLVPKLTRKEKSLRTRAALLDSAARIVGEVGYEEAQVAAITARAKIAHGTFYNYFESRQDLFNQMLPTLGKVMLEQVRHSSEGATTDLERESKSFRAFFDFLVERPEFYRILFEGHVFCPEAYDEHITNVSSGFVRVLARAHKQGEIKGVSSKELEAVAFMLMGAREYLAMRYARSDGKTKQLPEWVANLYDKLVGAALYGK